MIASYLVNFLCKRTRKNESLRPKFVVSKAPYNMLNKPHTSTLFYSTLCNKLCNRSSLSNVWVVFQNRATNNWNQLLAKIPWLLCNQTVHFRITGPRHEADHVQVFWRQGLCAVMAVSASIHEVYCRCGYLTGGENYCSLSSCNPTCTQFSVH
jgi:hypothetical protein